MIDIIEVKTHLAQALDISNESGSIDKLKFFDEILIQLREGATHIHEKYTINTLKNKYEGSITDSSYRKDVSNIGGEILELEHSLIESFEFNWIQLYATFERVLRSFGLPHIPFTHYTEKGETWGDYTLEQRKELLEKISVYSCLRSYFKCVCNQFSDENKSKIEQAIRGVECMHYAKDAYLNNHIQGTGVYLMRAATYKSNLALQSNERLAKIGKSTTRNSKKKGSYVDDVKGRPSLYPIVGRDIQAVIDKYYILNPRSNITKAIRDIYNRIKNNPNEEYKNIRSKIQTFNKNNPNEKVLVLNESTIREWHKSKKLLFKKVRGKGRD